MKNISEYKISLVRPGGNDTALVKGIPDKTYRKYLNDLIMKQFPTVEQVGFYESDALNLKAKLEMAGGEFCGNAARSLAYLLLNGVRGELTISVSGTTQALRAGVREAGTAFSYMPIYNEFSNVKQINKNLYVVELEGIAHVITPKNPLVNTEELKIFGRYILEENRLLYSRLASGVVFVSEIDGELSIEPIVWVRDVQTFFYETACASGTTAVGLWKSSLSSKYITKLNIKQPSGQIIAVTVKKNRDRFISSVIDGPVMVLEDSI